MGASHDFWGKRDRKTGQTLSLVDHSADVAAVLVALLTQTLLGPRLARIGGQDELHPVQVARQGFLAALHDLGKCGVRFQRKILDDVEEWAGHVREAMSLLGLGQDWKLSQRFYALLPEEIVGWADDDALGGLFASTICHHGQPRRGGRPAEADWEPRFGIDPFEHGDGTRIAFARSRAKEVLRWIGLDTKKALSTWPRTS